MSWFYFFHTLQEKLKLISFQPRHQMTTCCAASTCYNWIHCELSYPECSLACMYMQRWLKCTCVQAYMQYVMKALLSRRDSIELEGLFPHTVPAWCSQSVAGSLVYSLVRSNLNSRTGIVKCSTIFGDFHLIDHAESALVFRGWM